MPRKRANPSTPRPEWAETLRHRRVLELRGKSQEAVAEDSGILTQRTVSELERGRYSPEDLTSRRVVALARGLEWTPYQLQAATGLDLGFLPDGAPLTLAPITTPIRPFQTAGTPMDSPPRAARPTAFLPAPLPRDGLHTYTFDRDPQTSAAGHRVHPGDTIFIDPNATTLEPDRTYAVRDARGAFLAVTRRFEDRVVLVTDAAPTGVLDASAARIVGRVIGIGRYLED